MATLINNPHAVANIVERLERMNVVPQDLHTADEFPVAQTMMDNISHTPNDIQHFLIKHELPEAQFLNDRQYEPMLDPFEYQLPSEFDIDSFLSFPDILSTVDLSELHVDDLSMGLDEMEIDSDSTISSLVSLPEPDLTTFFENPHSPSSTYTSSSASPPAPSFYNFLEEAGIDIEQYDTFLKSYSHNAEWEDTPFSIRECQIQEMYLAQVEDLCNEMEGITMSQNWSGSISPTVPVEFGMTVAQDQPNSLGLFNADTDGLSPMPLGDLICINSFNNGGREEVESTLWAAT